MQDTPTQENPHYSAKRRFDAVIFDIDGCLIPEDSSPLNASALARIAEHNRRAIGEGDRPVVTVCSGRPHPFAEAMCRLLHNTTLPCIAENGVWLFFPDQNRSERDPAIRPEHTEAVIEATKWVEAELGPRGVTIQPGKASSISLFHPDPAFLKELCPMIEQAFRVCGWPFRVSMTWRYINCDLAHVSKSTAIERFIAATGIATERLAGVGDTQGDMMIREHVAWFACPANADEKLKVHADYVSAHAEIEGSLDILERLCEG
ncbi:MAG: HAD family phosphatase [Phycisphaerales bacterium]|nr:MAG: HAD family phosphatase [Phycisphaerales bacterium]